jgi:hypothetical protein
MLVAAFGAWMLVRSGDGPGLSGAYFGNADWDGRPAREDVLDADISGRAEGFRRAVRRASGGPFSVEWTGSLDVPQAGSYTFATNAKDAAWVWLDGLLVASDGEPPGAKPTMGARQLHGGRHELKIRYVSRGSEPSLEVLWAPPGGSLEPIPSSRLRPPALARRAQRAIGYALLSLLLITAFVLRRDFILLFAVLVYVNLPYLTGIVWDARDTNTGFQIFWAHYNAFYFSGRLALWLPYGTYGQPADFTMALSGVQYLGLVVGKALRVTNVWRLFIFTMLVEQTFLLLGMFLLARRLFARRSAVFMVCLASIGSTVWYWHYFFNLRMVCLLPLLLFFIFSFFDTGRPHHLWLTGICAVFWAQGSTFAAAIWLLVCCLVAIPLSRGRPRAWLAVRSPSRANLTSLTAFVLLAACYVFVTASSTRELMVRKSHRDTETGKVSMSVFLEYGGRPSIDAIVKDLLTGQSSSNRWDNNLYMGLLPVFFFVWALWKVRGERFLSIALATLALAWLAFGGLFATVVYYFPLMTYYRWLAWMYPTIKTLAILVAGFGFDRFWSESRWRQGLWVLVLLLFAMDATGVPPGMVVPRAVIYLGALAAAAVLMNTARWAPGPLAARLGKPRLVQGAVIAALALDLYGYQRDVWKKLPRLPPHAPGVQDMVAVQRMAYEPQRADEPTAHRTVEVLRRTPVTYAPQSYAFLLWDPCTIGAPTGYLQTLPRRTFQLLRLPAPALSSALACNAPKLRLVRAAEPAKDATEAARLIQEGALTKWGAILELAPDDSRGLLARAADATGDEVRVTGFDSNTLEAEAVVADGDGAWLVYADGFHPAWQATVDGRPAKVVPANLAFKGVHLPPGKSRVRFEFWDGWASIGLYVLAGSSVLISSALLAWAARIALSPSPADGDAPRGAAPWDWRWPAVSRGPGAA